MADYRRDERPKSEFEERVVSVDRVSYTVAGGRRLRFRALVVVGNRAGKVGMGIAKAGEVATAVKKAVTAAKKRLIEVPIVHETIPYAIDTRYGSAHVFLKPARPGTSVIAGGSVRAVIELAGIKNILSKAYGSNSKINNVAATLEALRHLRPNPRHAVKIEVPKPEPDGAGETAAVPAAGEKPSKKPAAKPKKRLAKKPAKSADGADK